MNRARAKELAERIQKIIEDAHDAETPPDLEDINPTDEFFAAIGYLDQARELFEQLADKD